MATERSRRTEIFRTLSKRLRQVIRTLNLTPEDVESLERSLQSFDAVLQRLEIAPENQLSDLRALLHSTATRFESLDPAPALPPRRRWRCLTRNFPALWSADEARRLAVPDLKRRPKLNRWLRLHLQSGAGGGVYSGSARRAGSRLSPEWLPCWR